MGKERPNRRSGQQEFYGFFCRWSSDAGTAAVSVAAGCVAGGLLVAAMAGAAIITLIRSGSTSPRSLMLFALAACFAVTTYATWKRVVSGAIINAILGLGLIVWLCTLGDPAIAVVLFVPAVCGSVTAARGAYVLNDLAKR
jgi:hypothetical protein